MNLKAKAKHLGLLTLFQLKNAFGVGYIHVPLSSRVMTVIATDKQSMRLYRDWLVFGVRIMRYQINTFTTGGRK